MKQLTGQDRTLPVIWAAVNWSRQDVTGDTGSGEAVNWSRQDVTGNTGSGEAVNWSRQDVTGDTGSGGAVNWLKLEIYIHGSNTAEKRHRHGRDRANRNLTF